MVDPASDASQTTLAWAVESTFKTPPTGAYQKARIVSDSLGREPEIIKSDEIDGSRQVVDNILAFEQGSGGVAVEFSYGAHDTWLQYALLSGAWAGSVASPSATMTVLVSGTTTNFVLDVGTWAASGAFAVGQIVRAAGWTGTSTPNNGYWKITGISGDTLACRGIGFTDASSTSATVEQLDQVLTGTTLESITIEREYVNSALFAQLSGMAFAGFSIESSKRDKVRGEFRFLGATETGLAATASSSKTSATTNRVFSVNGHLDTFEFNGDRTARMTAFRLDYDNGLYVIDDAGYATPEDIGIGDAVLEGNYEFWYRDKEVFDEAESFSDVSFLVAFEDADGNGFGWEVINCNLGAGKRNTPGKSQGVIGTMPFHAKKDTTELVTLRLFRRTAP
jgi:hypothetical protein